MITRFEFMHLDMPLAVLNIDPGSGEVSEISDVRNTDRMPVGTVNEGRFYSSKFRAWWSRRSIPSYRDGAESLLSAFNANSTLSLSTRASASGLEDCYWIRPLGSESSWEDVSFLRNPFSNNLKSLLEGACDEVGYDLLIPDFVTRGRSRKAWICDGGRRMLVKFATGFNQEPFNELIGSWLADAIGLPHANYRLDRSGTDPVSVCDSFVREGEELVHATDILLEGCREEMSARQQYLRICDRHGIDTREFMAKLVVLDFLMANNDRHTDNFGIIRDAETLEWIRPAPAYNFGRGLFGALDVGGEVAEVVIPGMPKKCMLSDLDDLSWLDIDAVYDVIERAEGLLASVRSFSEAGIPWLVREIMGCQAYKLEAHIGLEDLL